MNNHFFTYCSKRLGLLAVLTFLYLSSMAQTLVRGVVTDVQTKETLPYVSITVPGTTIGAKTDLNGKFVMSLPATVTKITFSYVGYSSVSRTIVPGKEQTVNVQLRGEGSVLKEVVIKSGRRKKYRNKNNPAVELIEKVIANKEKNRMESYPYAEFEKYEKISFALSDISEKFQNRKVFKNYQFLFQKQDSTAIGGTTIMPLYMEETMSKNYYRKDPEKTKSVIIARKKVDLDPRYFDKNGVSNYMNRLYEDINIYDNNVSVLTNQFLSPISNNAPLFYMYFITDTLNTDHGKLIELSFAPRNKGDMLFVGKLYVTQDNNFAVQGATLGVHKNINLNFIREFRSNLEFARNTDGRYHLSKSTLEINFGITKNSGAGMMGERTVSFKDYQVNVARPDSVYDGPATVVTATADSMKNSYWVNSRHGSLPTVEAGVYANIDSLQRMKSFRRTVEWATFLIAGYKSIGPYFEVGPANTFYSFNPVEGFRLRLGGRTTPQLSKRYYFETYGAYGFKDQKWKYFGSATYSINNKSIYSFPQHYLRTSYQRDTKIPGQELQFVQEDNFLLSFKRGENDKWLYNDIWRVDYVHEFENHFSFALGFKNWRQSPAGGLKYEYYGDGNALINKERINTSEFSMELRYAPNEKFYQGKIYRIPIISKYPIFTLRYTQGLKGILGSEYNYQNITGNIQKRFYLSQLGYTDVTAEGAYIFGQAPFPLLSIHRANQTYAYQLNSYNLMNFLEFVSDHYASINMDHCFNGFIFNKIPLLRSLKLREVMSFKGLWGSVRSENNPTTHPDLLRFPRNDDGVASTYTLEKQPYIEGSVGISNIFKLLRVDLVKRFTYLDHPNVAEWGVRARVKFDF